MSDEPQMIDTLCKRGLFACVNGVWCWEGFTTGPEPEDHSAQALKFVKDVESENGNGRQSAMVVYMPSPDQQTGAGPDVVN